MGRKNIPDNIYGKLYIKKIETRHQKILDKFTSKEEVIQYYSSNSIDKPCEKNNVQGLICFENNMGYSYFYLPNIDKNLAKKRNFPSFLFSCDKTDDFNCLSRLILLSTPHNIGVMIYFNDPKNIFFILDYVDKHFYNVLGEHLWQPLPKRQHKSDNQSTLFFQAA